MRPSWPSRGGKRAVAPSLPEKPCPVPGTGRGVSPVVVAISALQDETRACGASNCCARRAPGGSAQREPAASRACLGSGDRGRVGALRRVRNLRLRPGRCGRRRDRRRRADAARRDRGAVRSVARRPLSPRAVPACECARRLRRASRLDGRLPRRKRCPGLCVRRRRRAGLHALPAGAAGTAALARPNAGRADRLQRRNLDAGRPRHTGRTARRRRARVAHGRGARICGRSLGVPRRGRAPGAGDGRRAHPRDSGGW